MMPPRIGPAPMSAADRQRRSRELRGTRMISLSAAARAALAAIRARDGDLSDVGAVERVLLAAAERGG